MAERFLGLAATTLATRFVGRATAGRATELRAVRRVEESFASAWEGSCATSRAMAGRASESAAAASNAMRASAGAPAAQKLGRPSESIGRELPAAASSGFLRARSHWARRACTSASTHSSKISCSSLRRLATAFIDFIDITRVITFYSMGVAVPVRRGGGRVPVRRNAGMGLAGRRFTDTLPISA